jgi:single-strand DNA-binding protein
MSDKIPMTITGNLCADPELRATSSGISVANFTVASTPRTYNAQTGKWEDAPALFMRCNVWREQGENVAASLRKGTRVVVTGTLKQRSWTDDNDQKRSVYELEVEEVAASLKFAQVTVKRIARDRDAA